MALRIDRRRDLLLWGFITGSLVLALSLPPIAPDPAYHDFADTRTVFGIPNFFNVTSNLLILLAGLAGLMQCARLAPGGMKHAWCVTFTAMVLVAFGSAYYHAWPGEATLFWDRLPMVLGFMGLSVVLIGEVSGAAWAGRLLVPALVVGLASLAMWRVLDDLRLYAWVQALPLLLIPVILSLYPARHSHRWLWWAALAGYALAKAAEFLDSPLFEATGGLVSGHTAKHSLAALGGYTLVVMLRVRARSTSGT